MPGRECGLISATFKPFVALDNPFEEGAPLQSHVNCAFLLAPREIPTLHDTRIGTASLCTALHNAGRLCNAVHASDLSRQVLQARFPTPNLVTRDIQQLCGRISTSRKKEVDQRVQSAVDVSSQRGEVWALHSVPGVAKYCVR